MVAWRVVLVASACAAVVRAFVVVLPGSTAPARTSRSRATLFAFTPHGGSAGASRRRAIGGGWPLAGWHPGTSTKTVDEEEDQEGPADDYHENWRQMRIEDLKQSRYLGASEVSEIMSPGHLEKHIYAMHPEQGFGAIFQLEVLSDVCKGVMHPAWVQVARDLNKTEPSLEFVEKAMGLSPAYMVVRKLRWAQTPREAVPFVEMWRAKMEEMAPSYEPKARTRYTKWLDLLKKHKVPCGVLCQAPLHVVNATIHAVGLQEYFPEAHYVSGDIQYEDDRQGFLQTAIRIRRPPNKCAVYDFRPEGMICAHDAEMKGVCTTDLYAVYELFLADLKVLHLDDMNLFLMREMFAEVDFEPMPELEALPEPKKQVKVLTKTRTEVMEDQMQSPDRGGGGGPRGPPRRRSGMPGGGGR